MAEKFQINETCQATNQKELRNLLKQEKQHTDKQKLRTKAKKQ